MDNETKVKDEAENKKIPAEQKEDQTEDNQEMDAAEKSEDLTEDDLAKSLDKLQDYVKSNDSQSKKEVLLEKAQKGTLEKSERDELFSLLGGSEGNEESNDDLADEITKSFDDNEALQKSIDASEYLEESKNELVKSLTTLSNHIEQSDKRQQEFNLVLAKAIYDVGNLAKSTRDLLDKVVQRPVGQPKSKGVAPLQKSFANQTDINNQLSKSQIIDQLDNLARKSIDAGQGGVINGVDMLTALTQYEQFNTMSPKVYQMVKDSVKN